MLRCLVATGDGPEPRSPAPGWCIRRSCRSRSSVRVVGLRAWLETGVLLTDTRYPVSIIGETIARWQRNGNGYEVATAQAHRRPDHRMPGLRGDDRTRRHRIGTRPNHFEATTTCRRSHSPAARKLLIIDSTQRPQPVSQTAKSPLGHTTEASEMNACVHFRADGVC